MVSQKVALQITQKKKIQINSFLQMQCDLRRKLEVVFLKAQSTDYTESPEDTP